MRWFGIVSSVVLAAAIGGLATNGCDDVNFSMQGRTVNILTEPDQARVYQLNTITGQRTLLGHTPLMEQQILVLTNIKFKKASKAEFNRYMADLNVAHIFIEKAGYETYEGRLSTKKGETVTHQIKLVPAKEPAQEKQ